MIRQTFELTPREHKTVADNSRQSKNNTTTNPSIIFIWWALGHGLNLLNNNLLDTQCLLKGSWSSSFPLSCGRETLANLVSLNHSPANPCASCSPVSCDWIRKYFACIPKYRKDLCAGARWENVFVLYQVMVGFLEVPPSVAKPTKQIDQGKRLPFSLAMVLGIASLQATFRSIWLSLR